MLCSPEARQVLKLEKKSLKPKPEESSYLVVGFMKLVAGWI